MRTVTVLSTLVDIAPLFSLVPTVTCTESCYIIKQMNLRDTESHLQLGPDSLSNRDPD